MTGPAQDDPMTNAPIGGAPAGDGPPAADTAGGVAATDAPPVDAPPALLPAGAGTPRHAPADAGLTVAIRAKRFGAAAVLGPIAFALAPGQRAALLGPSGVGKSTLLALVAGLDAAFDGHVDRPAGRLAMVFQQPRLLPWRTLAQNIALIPGAGDLDDARALLARVGLRDAADMHPERVSLGMQRRAALARALAVRPALMLMDEPLASLDPDNAAAMRALIAEALRRTAATALIATHDRREALALTDRLIEIGAPTPGAPATILRDRPNPLPPEARADPAALDAAAAQWGEPAARG
jgi:ABC-type nitrate/sulfonate/bicarbonate transport system ATPase subunit